MRTRLEWNRDLRRLAGWLAAAALVGGLAATAGADQGRALKAHYHGTFTISQFGVLDFSGSGKGHPVGKSTIVGHSQLAPTANPLCNDIVQDLVTLTTKHGDTLDLVNHGQDCFDPNTNTIGGTVSFVIVGGSGRFAGASGSGTTSVVADPVTGTFKLSLKGRIFGGDDDDDCDDDD